MIGDQIKILRKQINMTILEMSQITKLSTGYISNIERNVTSPTLENLELICKCLRITISSLLKAQENANRMVKKDERQVVWVGKERMMESLTRDMDKPIYGICMTLYEDCKQVRVSYTGNEYDQFGIVEEGIFQITIQGVTYVCEPGDTIYIDAHVPYEYRKLGQGICRTYWCNYKKN